MRYTHVIAIALLSSNFFAQAPPQAQKPLGSVELLALQIEGVSSKRLSRSVTDRGIDFQPGGDFLNAMTEAGAQENLIVVLKSAKPAATSEPSDPGAKAREALVLEHLIRAAELNRNRFHPEDAEPECRAAVQADPENAFAHLVLGNMLNELRRGQSAVAEFKEALRLQPGLAEAHTDLGEVLSGEGEVKAAIVRYREAVRLEPDDARAHWGLGVALQMKGDKQGAEHEDRIAKQLGYPSLPKRIRMAQPIKNFPLIYAPPPKCPPEAKRAHIQGLVSLEVLIGTDGGVKDVKVRSGDPTLAKAAMEAVSRWIYKPVTLNGQPLEVITEANVNFTLR